MGPRSEVALSDHSLFRSRSKNPDETATHLLNPHMTALGGDANPSPLPDSPDSFSLVLPSLGSPAVSSLVEWETAIPRRKPEVEQLVDYRSLALFQAGNTPASVHSNNATAIIQMIVIITGLLQ